MIYFFADNHYDSHPGKSIYENFSEPLQNKMTFLEDDWELLESGQWVADCDLLILNMIAGTCGQPMPGSGAEKAVKRYCESGKNILMLHGSSSAFWDWKWWREIVGLRWVRPGDPDQVPASTHPKESYQVLRTKSRHPLVKKLQEFSLPKDEIYTELEETSPLMSLMQTTLANGTFTQSCEAINPWGGKMVSFIPGHCKEATANPILIQNIEIIIKYLL